MAHSLSFEVPISFHGEISTTHHHHLKRPTTSSLLSSASLPHLTTKHTHMRKTHGIKPTRPLSDFSSQFMHIVKLHTLGNCKLGIVHWEPTILIDITKGHEIFQNPRASNISTTQVEEQAEVEVAEGYTMTKFCDKMIDVFMNEKPRTKDWRMLLVFRDEWNKYKENFYNRCQARADAENDSIRKQEFIRLARKVKKIDDEMERHTDLLKEIQENPTDINAVVARRRDDFTGEFFRHFNVLSETYDSLEDRDAMARLGAKCLSAVSAYDNAVENVEMLDVAQSKFDDILNSPSLDAACEKIKNLAKAKELDSSLILLINKAWASAKESTTMKNEVKDIMYHLYRTTKSCLRSIAPKEIKLLKYLLNITDPEERFSALATAFSPGDEREAKDVDVLYTTPQELHKWIKIMLEAYHINKEETDLREARQLSHPMVIQRLFILKETIEEEYMKQRTEKGGPETKEADEDISL